ncbi:MAG TPA: helix-turn-helix transcriptional regulator [Pseudonocardiaceae bacterium]|nr:helix-turn-helix transcriptional regulator [Pseudonocardiaceae bacterium]
MGIYDAPMDDALVKAILGSIGNQVRDARIGRGWFLEDLAMRVGVSTSVICRLELARREASVSQLLTTCAVFNRRLSGVLRIAEDEAFPLGGAPWA